MSFLRKLGLAPVPDAAVLDAMSLEPLAELNDVGGWDGDVAASEDAVWFSTYGKRAVSRIDPVTREEVQRVKLPRKPQSLTVDGSDPIVVCEKETIVRVDAATGTVSAQAELPGWVGEVGAVGGSVWVPRSAEDGGVPFPRSLLQVDPHSLAVIQEVQVGSSTIGGGLRVGDGVVTTLIEDPPGSMREMVFDASTGAPLPDDRAPKHRGIAERDGFRWIKDGGHGFKRVEIATGNVLAEGEAPGPDTGGATVAHGCLWVCNFRRPRPGGSNLN